jgi:hypothetical protein
MTGMAGVRFWRETASRYNLAGNRCGVCGTVFFPPRPVCLKCHRESLGKMEDMRLRGTGEVLSFTVVHESRRNFELQLPYIMAIIRMDEGPALTAQLVDCSPQDVKMGSRVTAVFRKIGEEGKAGVIYYGYKFVLI